MKRRVLHLIDGLGGGGAEEWVKEIVRLADRTRFDFDVCTTFTDDDRYAEDIRRHGGRVLLKGLYSQNARRCLSRIAQLPAWLRLPARGLAFSFNRVMDVITLRRLHKSLARQRYDVIHIHMYRSFLYGVRLKKMLRIPRAVYTVPATREHITQQTPWMVPLFRRFASRVDVFVTFISADEAAAMGVPPDKVRWLQGAIDLSQVRPVPRDANPVVREFGLDGAFPILVSVARLSPMKGHEYALRAVARLRHEFPNVRLLILGQGGEHERLMRLAEELGVQAQVTLPGFRTDLPNFHSVADVYLRTSVYEGGHRACYLAMAYERPVVGFDTKAPSENIVSGQNGLLVPNRDAEALADGVARLARDADLRARLGQAGAEDVRAHWDIRHAIRAYEDIYAAAP